MEKQLPHNMEAESGVLGSILIDPEAIAQVVDFLQPEDFYRNAHRTIFSAMLSLFEQHAPPDLITVCDLLERHGRLEEVGGPAYITSLINHVPTSMHLEHYGRIVSKAALHRRLIGVAGRIAALGFEEADHALDTAEELVYGLGSRSIASEVSSVGSVFTEFFNQLGQLPTGGSIVGVPSGLYELDKVTRGFQRSDLIILAGRPATGKTSMCLSIAANAAISYGCGVLIFSCEMSKMQLIQRLTGMLTGVNVQRLFTRQINEDEMERVVAVGQTIDAASLWIDDTPALTLSALRSKLRRTLAEQPIDLVIVDYLQLMQATIDGKRVRDRLQEVSEVARGLKNVAREFNLPLLALAQLSRAVEVRAEKRPQLSDLRECVVGSTRLIEAKTGKWVPIEQIQPGDEVLGLGKQQKIGRFTVQHVWRTGTKPVFRLTTRTGRQLVATANHPLLTPTGWKALGELGSEDRIATAMRLPEHGKEMPERADVCRLPGYMVGVESAERLDDPLLHEWATGDLLWEKVSSIEPYGEAETFDISVPGANNFLADGIIAHNSGELEQAADIVMFIHRDDYYAGFDPETGKSLSTRPKTADILIAKHRNGPIGNVVLGFEASQTKFYNLDEPRTVTKEAVEEARSTLVLGQA